MKFTIAYWCVLIAAFLPIVCAGIAKYGSFGVPRREGGFDNHAPREWLAKQTGWRARANAAQANTFEALPFFFVAVVIAHMVKAPQIMVDLLAGLWVFFRLLFIMMYVGDMPGIRTGVWIAAFAANIGLMVLAAFR